MLLTCYPSFPPTFLPPLLLLSPRPAPLSSPETPLALLHPLTSTSCTYPYVQPSSSLSSPSAQACKPSACAVECRPPLLSLPHPLPLLSAHFSPAHNPPRSYSPPESYDTFLAFSFSNHVFATISSLATANSSTISPSTFLTPYPFPICQ